MHIDFEASRRTTVKDDLSGDEEEEDVWNRGNPYEEEEEQKGEGEFRFGEQEEEEEEYEERAPQQQKRGTKRIKQEEDNENESRRSRGGAEHNPFGDVGSEPIQLDEARPRKKRKASNKVRGGDNDDDRSVHQALADASYMVRVAAPSEAGAQSSAPAGRRRGGEGGGGGPGGQRGYTPDQPIDYLPVQYTHHGITFDELDELDRKNIPGIDKYWHVCQLCKRDRTEDQKEEWVEFNDLLSFDDKNGHYLTQEEVAIQMSGIYNKFIRECIDGAPPMRTRMFWLHVDVHAPTIKHVVESSLRNFNNEIRVLRDEETYLKHSVSGRIRIHHPSARLSMQLERERKPFIKMAMDLRAAAAVGKYV